jgi:hypothetical protein
VAHQVLREFRQLGAVQFAIAVGIKRHGMRDDSLNRGRTAWATATAWAASTRSRSTSRSAGTTGAVGPFTAGPGTRLRPVVGRTVAGTFESAGSVFGLRVATELSSAVLASCSRSAWSALRMQFVLRQLSVAVLVEFLERRRCVGDLFGREFSIMVGVEHFHQRIARRSVARATVKVARRRSLTVVVTPRRSFRRLRHDNGRSQSTQDSGDVKRATHRRSPKSDATQSSGTTHFALRRSTKPGSIARTIRRY